jgi:multicomponent Na+:H+ antiporter subunit G
VASILALGGAFFTMVAGLGTFRLPDLYMRMHAATKAGSLGLGLFLVGIAILHPTPHVILKCVAIIAFIFLTSPVAAHLIGRAAYLHRTKLSERTRSDALEGKYAKDHTRLDS